MKKHPQKIKTVAWVWGVLKTVFWGESGELNIISLLVFQILSVGLQKRVFVLQIA